MKAKVFGDEERIGETASGFEWKITRQLQGHLCGYVFIPNHSLLMQVPPDVLEREIEVHGGITFDEVFDDCRVLGFDCAHYGDSQEKMNVDFVKRELENIGTQLRALEKKNGQRKGMIDTLIGRDALLAILEGTDWFMNEHGNCVCYYQDKDVIIRRCGPSVNSISRYSWKPIHFSYKWHRYQSIQEWETYVKKAGLEVPE